VKIIEPSFEIRAPYGFPMGRNEGVLMLQFIEEMARISHRTEDKQTADSWEKFIKAVVCGHGDWSVTEHATVTVLFRVDRGVTHELVRHRLFSFTQESTRFVNYKKKGGELEFIRPVQLPDVCERSFAQVAEQAEVEYFDLLVAGARPQEARAVLPNALASTIAVTGNLRSWRWFFLARTSLETHADFRRVSIPLLEKFKEVIPLLYDDIEPNQKQSISMAKAH
jgi:thymidylate synthase (FAD)